MQYKCCVVSRHKFHKYLLDTYYRLLGAEDIGDQTGYVPYLVGNPCNWEGK